MNKITKLLVVVLLISFVLPSIALASWWNPFSWFNYWGRGNNQNKENITEIATSTIDARRLEDKTNIQKQDEKKDNPKQTIKGVPTDDLKSTVDNFIKAAQIEIASINEYKKHVDYYYELMSSSQEAVLQLLEIETDPYLIKGLNYLKRGNDLIIKNSITIKNSTTDETSISYLVRLVDNYVSPLKSYRNNIPDYLPDEEIISEMRRIGKEYFRYADETSTKIHEAHSKFLEDVSNIIELAYQIKKDTDEYVSSYRVNYNSAKILNTYPSSLPKIQTPTFTYCSYQISSYGQGSVICNNSPL
jgi:hypothetical protein